MLRDPISVAVQLQRLPSSSKFGVLSGGIPDAPFACVVIIIIVVCMSHYSSAR